MSFNKLSDFFPIIIDFRRFCSIMIQEEFSKLKKNELITKLKTIESKKTKSLVSPKRPKINKTTILCLHIGYII